MGKIDQKISNQLKEILLKQLSTFKNKKIALFLSGGAGSVSLLALLKELEAEVVAYTFVVEGHASTDLLKAQKYAKYFKTEHRTIELPSDIRVIKNDLLFLIQEKQFKLKTDIECGFPFLHSFSRINEDVIISGLGDDIYFGLTKRAQLHYSKSLIKNNIYRLKQLNKYRHQKHLIDSLTNIQHFTPFQSDEVYQFLTQFTFSELNSPKPKQVLLEIYPKVFETISPYKSSLQLGDSKIAELFKPLVYSSWNRNNYKSVVGVYNSIGRQEITKETELLLRGE